MSVCPLNVTVNILICCSSCNYFMKFEQRTKSFIEEADKISKDSVSTSKTEEMSKLQMLGQDSLKRPPAPDLVDTAGPSSSGVQDRSRSEASSARVLYTIYPRLAEDGRAHSGMG